MNALVTNPTKPLDGLGENIKYIILSIVYAELNDCMFVYSPLIDLQHNYDNDPTYLQRMEKLINIIDNFPTIDHETKSNVTVLNTFDLLHFYQTNIDACSKSKSLQRIKGLFRGGKCDPFKESSRVNIAIHIRRMNLHDYGLIEKPSSFEGINVHKSVLGNLSMDLYLNKLSPEIKQMSLPGMDVPDGLYNTMICQFESVYPDNVNFHIFSQGSPEEFECYSSPNVILHLNEPLEDTFTQMVYADILVTAPSALSYSAGLISNNIVYYINYCNPPLPHWHIVQNYTSSRNEHIFIMKCEIRDKDGNKMSDDDYNSTFIYDAYSDKFTRTNQNT